MTKIQKTETKLTQDVELETTQFEQEISNSKSEIYSDAEEPSDKSNDVLPLEVSESENVNLINAFVVKVRQFINNKNFDLETHSECQVMRSAITLWDIITSENEKMKEEFNCATKALESDPRLAVLFNELMRETPIRVALVRSGIYDFTPQPADGDFGEYQEALKAHKSRREEFMRRRKEHEKNCKCTAEAIDKFYEQNNVSEEQIKEFSDYAVKIFDGFVDGIIDSSLLELLWKGFIFDHKIDEAKEIGKIEGMNEVIERRENAMNDDGVSARAVGTAVSNPRKIGYIERVLGSKY